MTFQPSGSQLKKPSLQPADVARGPLTLRALEPRILFDAAAPAAAAAADHNTTPTTQDTAQQDQQQQEVAALIATLTQPATDAAPSTAQGNGSADLVAPPPQTAQESLENTPKTVVFIDAKVEGAAALIADLPSSVTVRLIGADENGVQVIGDTLAQLGGNVGAVHILAHGDEGRIALGNSILDTASLQGDFAQAVAQWGQSLNAGADLLLYGCSVAASPDGTAFVQQLAQLTHADVAASTNLTGDMSRGGDWVLEYSTGGIEAALPFSAAAMANFTDLLDDPVPSISSSAAADKIYKIAEAAELTITDFTVSDGDDSGNTIEMTVTVSAANGTVTLKQTTGLTFTVGDGTADATMTFKGTQDAINAALNQMKYKGTEGSGATDDYTGNDTITVAATGGNSKAINVNITPVNDVPVVSTPGVTVAEGGTVAFSNGTNFYAFSAVDPDNQTVQLIYKVVTLPTDGVLTFNGSPVVIGTVFDQTQIQHLQYKHDGSQVPSNTSDNFELLLEDGAGGIVTNIIVPVTITPVNQAPEAAGTTDVYEGQTGKQVTLTITDPDISDGPHSIEILSLPTAGVLKLNGVALTVGATFTSNDVANLTYDASADEPSGTPLTFQVKVTDNGGGEGVNKSTTSDIKLNVLYNNDDPILAVNTGAIMAPGQGSIVITNSMLQVTDPDSGTDNLTYTVVAVPPEGQLQFLDGSTWKYLTIGSTFTQQDIDDGKLRYSDLSVATYVTQAIFTVKDGGLRSYPDRREGGIYDDPSASATLTQIVFQIEANLIAGDGAGPEALDDVPANTIAPVIVSNTVMLDEGSSGTIATANLSTTDGDTPVELLVYRIETVSDNGTIYRGATALGLHATFSQKDVDDGLITYKHNGSENFLTTNNRIQLTVSDGTNISSLVDLDFDITPVNDQPTAEVLKVPVVNEGGSYIIDEEVFTLADVDGSGDKSGTGYADPNDLTFKITNLPTYGVLELDADNNGSFETTVDLTTVITKAQLYGGNLRYTHGGDEQFADSFKFQVNDNMGVNDGGGKADSLSTVYTVNIEAAPLNDPPVWSSQKDMTLSEGETKTIKGSNGFGTDNTAGTGDDEFHLHYTDPDNTTIQRQYLITNNVDYGTLKLNGAVLGVGSVFTQDDLDNNRVTYTHDGSENHADTFAFTVRDGAGGSVNGSYNITITPVNDAPTLTVPGTQTFSTVTPLTFSAGNSNRIVVGDPDYENTPSMTEDKLTVTLDIQKAGSTYGSAELTLSTTTGLTFTTGDGAADSIMTFYGTKADVQAALDGLQLQVPGDENATLRLVVTVNDITTTNNGNGGADPSGATAGYNIVTKNIDINTSNANDPPVITAPSSVTATEDTSLTFTSGNLISVADPDSFGSNITVTLEVQHGKLTLGTTSNISFDNSTANDSDTITISGSRTAVNAALASLSYKANEDYNGTGAGAFNSQVKDTLTITVDDNGNTGTGSGTDTKTVDITVDSVNDAPTLTAPTAVQYLTTGGALTFSTGNSNAISFDDAKDTPYELSTLTYRLTLASTYNSSGYGSLTLGSTTGISFITGTNGASSMVIEGTMANLNAALQGLQFSPAAGNPDISVDIAVTIDDKANGGTGALTETKHITVAISGSNDAPGITLANNNVSVNEDTDLIFNSTNSNLISIDDPDDFGAPLKVTLTVSHGVLTLSSTTGLTFTTGDGTSDATMTFTGTEDKINAALAGLKYRGDLNYNSNIAATDSLVIKVNDQGNTGAGGAQETTSTVTITVNPVDDAPAITRPATTQTVNEDTDLIFNSTNSNLISIADVDSDEGSGDHKLTMTLTVSHGVLTLSGTSGLTFTTGDGTSDATMTFSGTKADINTALAGLKYRGDQHYNGSDTLQIGVNDNSQTGSGGPLTDSKTVAITVAAVDDAPVITVPTAQTVNEDTDLTFSTGNSNLISIEDVDSDEGAGNHKLTMSLTVSHGVLTLSGTSGLTFTTGDGTSDATMTFSGTKANINAALAGLKYKGDLNYNGSDTLQIGVNDNSQYGSGGPLTDSKNIAITVSPVDDAPVITRPATTQTVNEDTDLTFSVGNSNLISIDDVDSDEGSGDHKLTMTLTVSHGVITLSGTTGLTFTTGDGTSDATMTFSGTKAAINAALAGLKYKGDLNYNGSDTLQIAVDDNSQTGSGGPLTDSKTVAITVSPVDDAPVITRPATTQTVNEDTDLTFSTANSNLISIDDVDSDEGAGDHKLTMTLTVSHGVLTLSGTTGLTFTTGDGTSDATMTFSGTKANINTALAGLKYKGDLNYNGSDTLQINVNDNGQYGSGGPLTDAKTVAITVDPVDDAPVITRPATTQTVNEDTDLTFSTANTNLISIEDVDSDEGSGDHKLTMTLVVTHGVLTLSGTAGLTFTAGDGTSDATMTFSGTKANINAALAGLKYKGDLNYNGSDTLSIDVNDNSQTGSGGPLTDAKTVAITVNPVDDAPVITVPTGQTVNEDTDLTFSTANSNLISIDDIDSDEGSGDHKLTMTLTVSHGVITLSGTSGLTFTTGDGTADATMTFSGTKADINAALAGLKYKGNLNYNGSDTLQLNVNDNSQTGSGGPLTDTKTIALTVSPVDDAPVITVPATQSVAEDTDLTFSVGNSNLISIDDVDSDEGSGDHKLTMTLTVGKGTLTLSGTSGLTFTAGDGTSDATMTFSGTKANINAALAGLVYRGDPDDNSGATSTDTLDISVNDNSQTGSGGPLTDTKSVLIEVGPINDPPVITRPTAAQHVNEDTDLVFNTANSNLISIADVDADEGTGDHRLTVTLTVTHGVITLSGTNGLTFTTGDGTSDATMTFSGSQADIRAALDGLKYRGNLNYNSHHAANDTLQIEVTDNGNTGSGGPLTDTKSVSIVVDPVDDAPVLTVPTAQTVREDTDLVFNSTNSNLISLDDIDSDEGSGDHKLTVTLTVSHGVLTLSSITGLTFTAGDGTSDATMTFSGTKANINAALAGLTYKGDLNYNGSDTLQLNVNDNSQTGSGGPLTDSKTVAITVQEVNDTPTIAVPGVQTVDEDVDLPLTGISFADVDDLGGNMTVTLTVSHGTLTLADTTGLTVDSGANGSATMTLTGTKVALNTAIANLTYRGNLHFNGVDTLSVTLNDRGNTGIDPLLTGGPSDEQAIASVTINVDPVDDAPNITAPDKISTVATIATQISGDKLISLADVDVGSGNMTVTLTVNEGTLTLASTTLITGGRNASETITLTGTLSQLNAALTGLSYLSSKAAGGLNELTIVVNDLGNTGSGGPLSATSIVPITVDPAPLQPPQTTTPPPPPTVVITPPPPTAPVDLTNAALNLPSSVSGNNSSSSSSTTTIVGAGEGQLGGAPLTVAGFVQSFFSLPINPVQLAASMQDRVLGEQTSETFSIPASAFRHSDPSEQIAKEAKQPDGSALPSFVQFNPQTGEFSVNAQEARSQGVEAVDVKVVGRDKQGNEASADFRIILTNPDGSQAPQGGQGQGAGQGGQQQAPGQQTPGQQTPGQQTPGQQGAEAPAADGVPGSDQADAATPAAREANAAQAGKPGLTEQLRQTGPSLFQAQRDALLAILQDRAA
jgi:hypothetical protein